MKKFSLILTIFLFVMFVPFLVNAEICEPEKVTIESIEISNKTNNVTEKSEPVIHGKIIDLNLKMKKVGDSIEYKMIVKNDSKEDYKLDKTALSANRDYIEYTLETKDDSNIIKSGEAKEVLLRVQYKNEVSDDSFVNGVYNDSKNIQINLSNKDTTNIIKNPKTGFQVYLIFFIILILSISLLMISKKNKIAKYMFIIIGIATMIPISVYAICKCDFKVNSSVEITKSPQFRIRIVNCGEWIDDNYEFDYGMTLRDWVNSDYINPIIQETITRRQLSDDEETWEYIKNEVKDELLYYFTRYMGYEEDYIIQPNDFLDHYSPVC